MSDPNMSDPKQPDPRQSDAAPFDLSTARICVVMNPGSGKNDEEGTLKAIRETLGARAAELRVDQAQSGTDIAPLAERAVADGFDVVIASGGDGTQSAVAGALAGGDAIMGVVPGGTFNYFARDLGVGETVEEALETLLDARVAPTDVAEVNGLVFLNNISLGAYPRILQEREAIYRRFGRSRIAAYWSVLRALAQARRPMSITTMVDGEERRWTTALIFVATSAYQLEMFGVEGADAVRNGKLVVLIATARQPRHLIGPALRLALGRPAHGSDFETIITDELTITSRPAERTIAHDGEKTRMASPLYVRARPGALRVLVPRSGSKTDGAGE